MANPNLAELLRKAGIRPIEISRELGVDKTTVSRWCSGRVPSERCLDVERVTGISRHELRPDVFGPAKASAA